jgi:hypothetical protein
LPSRLPALLKGANRTIVRENRTINRLFPVLPPNTTALKGLALILLEKYNTAKQKIVVYILLVSFCKDKKKFLWDKKKF